MGIHYIIFVVLLILNCSSSEKLPRNSLVFEILEDHNAFRPNAVIKDIWEREPSSYCDIVKPSEKNLVDYSFVQFNFVPVLCMILYDASLRYMKLNMTLPENVIHNFSQIINQSSPNTFCQQMEENTWFTTIESNKKWVSNFDELLKKGSLCSRYCVSDIVNPLCSLTLWLDLSIKNGEHKLVETHNLKNQGSSKTLDLSVPETFNIAHAPAAIKKTNDAHASSNKNEDTAKKIDNKVQISSESVPRLNDNFSGVRTDLSSNLPNVGHPSKAQNLQNLSRPQPKKPLVVIEDGMTGQLHTGNSYANSEKDPANEKPVTINSSPKTGYVPGPDIITPVENFKQMFRNQPQPPKNGAKVTSLPQTVSIVSEIIPYDKAKNLGVLKVTQAQVPLDPVKQDKIVGGSTQPHEEQKTTENSSSIVKSKPSATETAPASEVVENSRPNKESVNTTDTVVKEKTKPGNSKELSEGFSKLPEQLDQIGRSEIDEANTANEPEFDDESPLDPDDHEDQKKLDDGIMGSQGEEGNPVGGLGGVNSPREQDDFLDSQDMATEEPRFDDADSLPKPEPSAKIAADYGGSSDEDDDTMLHFDGRITQNDAGAGFPHDRFVDAEDSHFFAYFMTMIILCILGYLIFHNKQKILALALEGRVRKGSRRRPSTSGYRKLDSNLEEAVTSNCTGSSVTHVIY